MSLTTTLAPRAALRLVFAVAVALPLAGCQSVTEWVPPLLKPYRPNVQQGNVITQEMVDQLREGMTREQVRFLLGTPLLASVFHPDRLDYVYHLRRGRTGEVETRRLVLYFKDNRLARFSADPMPPEAEADNLILGRDAVRRPRTAPARPQDPGTLPPGPVYF